MAAIVKYGTPSLASPLPDSQHQIPELKAGEALAAFDPCYIKSDGKVWKSTGAAANAAAKVDGWAAKATAVGEAVTLYFGVRVHLSNGLLTPGMRIYLGATAGALSDAATTGGTAEIGYAVDAYRAFLDRSHY